MQPIQGYPPTNLNPPDHCLHRVNITYQVGYRYSAVLLRTIAVCPSSKLFQLQLC